MAKDEQNNKPNRDLDIQSLFPLLELFSGMTKQPPIVNELDLEEEKPSFYFDNMITTDEMALMKTFIPYLDHAYAKPLAILVKLLELQNTLYYYSLHSDSNQTSELREEPGWQKKLLYDIRPYLTPDKKQTVDQLLQMMRMKTMMDHQSEDTHNTSANSGNNAGLHNHLKNMLTPEQQKLFNDMNRLMGTMSRKDDKKDEQ